MNLRLLFLHDIARIHYSRDRYAEAAEIWEPLSQQYLDQNWKIIAIFILENLSVCQKVLNKITPFIKTCFQLVHHPKLIKYQKVEDYIREVLLHTNRMEEEALIESPDILRIKICSIQNKIADDDIMTLTISVNNLLDMV